VRSHQPSHLGNRQSSLQHSRLRSRLPSRPALQVNLLNRLHPSHPGNHQRSLVVNPPLFPPVLPRIRPNHGGK
jgi:hypothetical protein